MTSLSRAVLGILVALVLAAVAALQALVIRQAFQIPNSDRRDARCAVHGDTAG